MRITSAPPTTRPVPAPARPAVDWSIPLVEQEGTQQTPLIIVTYGNEGGGKSRLAGTAPDPIGVLPLEHKALQTISATCVEFGKKMIKPGVDLIRSSRAAAVDELLPACITDQSPELRGTPADKMNGRIATEMQRISKGMKLTGDLPRCCQQHYYRWHANREKAVLLQYADHQQTRTTVVDTFGQLVEDILFANYGRTDSIMPLDRKSFNQEVRDLLNHLSSKHLILTHHEASVWENNKPTGQTKPMGSFSKIGHFVTVIVRQERYKVPRIVPGRSALAEYGMTVMDCQANAELIGTTFYDEDINFLTLAMAVYPDADPEQFL